MADRRGHIAAVLAIALAGWLPGTAMSQHLSGPSIDPSVTWVEATDRAWAEFRTHCRTALSDPNALIQRAADLHAAGQWAAISQTADGAHIAVAFRGPNVSLSSDFISFGGRAHLSCQVFGTWIGLPDPANPTALGLIDLPTLMARVSAHFTAEGEVSMGGGALQPVVGELDVSPMGGTALPMSVEGTLFETETWFVEGLWSDLEATVFVAATPGLVTFGAERQYLTK